MNILKRVWNDFSRTVIHDNRGIWPALAFLANPAFWAGVAKFIPTAASMLMNKGAGGESSGIDTSGGGLGNIMGGAQSMLGGGGQQQTGQDNSIITGRNQMPAQPPQQLFQYQQSPSYLKAIQEMLKQSRGF